tara:strand:- start:4516 stop:5250 length:735 start_codon:yes stop_codon:yes gene_type:complete
MGAYTDFIQQYGSDDKITKKDLKDFQSSGGSQSDAQKFLNKALEGKKGYEGTVADKALGYAGKDKKWDGGSSGNSTFADMTPSVFEQLSKESLETLRGQNRINYADAVGGYNTLAQTLIANSNDYAAQLGLQGTTYASDRNVDIAKIQTASAERMDAYRVDAESAAAKAVQALRNQGAIDLQAIINNGLADVAEIQGTYASERVELQGDYDVQRTNIQSDFEKFKANRAKEGQIYGSLMAGFWS